MQSATLETHWYNRFTPTKSRKSVFSRKCLLPEKTVAGGQAASRAGRRINHQRTIVFPLNHCIVFPMSVFGSSGLICPPKMALQHGFRRGKKQRPWQITVQNVGLRPFPALQMSHDKNIWAFWVTQSAQMEYSRDTFGFTPRQTILEIWTHEVKKPKLFG